MSAESYRELVGFVRSVRHDANNPLTAALGHVQLLLADPAVQDGEVRESLQTIEEELRRLSSILGRLNRIRDGAPEGGTGGDGSTPGGTEDAAPRARP